MIYSSTISVNIIVIGNTIVVSKEMGEKIIEAMVKDLAEIIVEVADPEVK
jgi:creatinine amidohydrolase/Fe(II)-dependent formamide hydrolase-like protein